MYSVLHQLVFGDDRDSSDRLAAAEEGKAPSAASPKPKEMAPEMSETEYCGKLVLCIVGLQASYLTWGVLQVQTTALSYSSSAQSGK